MTMQPSSEQPEVPSPLDFHDPAQATAWVKETVAKRPWRPQFFQAFETALNARFTEPFVVAELGSGPGHLAQAVLSACNVGRYTAIDFSEAMHALAREHIGPGHPITYELADFRNAHWVERVQPLDAVVTMQAAHEVRHRTRLPQLLQAMYDALRPGGLLLFCDHYAEPGSGKVNDLYVSQDEQLGLIEEAGFEGVSCLLDHGGMALYSAMRST